MRHRSFETKQNNYDFVLNNIQKLDNSIPLDNNLEESNKKIKKKRKNSFIENNNFFD
jgi:hypothetical protein